MTETKRSTLLIVDDDQSNIEILNEILEAEYDILFARNGTSALCLAKLMRPDLILLDVMMPGMDGYEVCRQLKNDSETYAIPVVFVTELSDIGAELKGLNTGAIDYITKPVSPPIVQMRVRNHIDLKQARDSLALLAITDSLTSLANRRHFDAMLNAECERLSRLQKPLSLVMLDIDFFKRFNDEYGHVIGDHCLKQVACVLRNCLLRPADLAARYGGEEFACILPYTDQQGALAIAERIRLAVAALKVHDTDSGLSTHVTVSLGIITGIFNPEISPAKIIELADHQLYQAKEQGRNRTCYAEY